MPRDPPIPSPRARGWDPAARWLGAILLSGTGPTLRTLAITEPPRPLLVGVLAVVGVAVYRRLNRHGSMRLGAACVTGLAAAPAGGAWVGLWLTLGIALAAWVMLDVPPHPSFPSVDIAALPPVVALSALAALEGRGILDRFVPVALTAACFGVAASASRHADRLRRFTTSFGHAVGVVASRLLFAALGLIVVVVPWSAGRLAGNDPLHSPIHRGTAWMARSRTNIRSDRPWAEASLDARPSRLRQLRWALTCVGLVAIIVIGFVRVLTRPPAVRADDTPAAFAGAEWHPDYVRQLHWVFWEQGAAYSPLRYPMMREAHTPWVNIEQGRRRTWSAPPCDCRSLTVWMYGGSTMIGMGQRDDHTIPSEFAKLAAGEGIDVEVQNRGIMGDLHWEEAQRFAWDLESEEPPDLAVFYDGYNEVVGAQHREREGLPRDGTPVDPTAEDAFIRADPLFGPFRSKGVRLGDEQLEAGWQAAPPEPSAPMTGEDLGRYVGQHYNIAQALSRRSSVAHGITTRWFWQPTLHTSEPVEGEEVADPSTDDYQRAVFRAAASTLPADVVDISHILDGRDEPLYWDDVHTNEKAAALVAQAIYERVRGDLLRLKAELNGTDR